MMEESNGHYRAEIFHLNELERRSPSVHDRQDEPETGL